MVLNRGWIWKRTVNALRPHCQPRLGAIVPWALKEVQEVSIPFLPTASRLQSLQMLFSESNSHLTSYIWTFVCVTENSLAFVQFGDLAHRMFNFSLLKLEIVKLHIFEIINIVARVQPSIGRISARVVPGLATPL